MLSTNVVVSDVIPLLCQYSQDRTLFNSALKVAANLTQPSILCFGGQTAKDSRTIACFNQIQTQLITMKPAFINPAFMKVLVEKMQSFLDQDWTEREEEGETMVDRILLLLRNILHIPECSQDSQVSQGESCTQDGLLWCILESGLNELLLFAGSNPQEKRMHLRIVEILMLMLRDHPPEVLHESGHARGVDERRRDQQIMQAALDKQIAIKKNAIRKCSGRHTNFAGSYVVQGMKSVNDQNNVASRRVLQPDHPSCMPWIDARKAPRRTPRNKTPLIEKAATQKSPLKLRQGLYNFCVQFVDLCYNRCMMSIRSELNGGAAHDSGKLQMNESYYYWSMHYFLQLGRLCSLPWDRVSESLSLSALHQCQTHLEECLELTLVHKDESRIWGRRAHLALMAYKQLLMCIMYMMQPEAGVQFNEQAKAIQGNIFYETEYRDLCLNLLRQYQPWNLSKGFLRDLIETVHIYLRLLEKHMKVDGNGLLVKKKRRKPKKSNKKTSQEKEDVPSLESLDELWDEMTEELCCALQGHTPLPTDAVPFDSAMDVDDTTHIKVAMGRIQKCLRERRAAEAVALFRASRELWPEEGIFGKSGIEPEEEFLELRQVLVAELEQIENDGKKDELEIEDDFVDEEIAQQDFIVSEVQFQFDEYVSRFARPDILKWYVHLLGDYSTNSMHLNRYLIKMLHRVIVDLKFTPLLFQARLFRVFQNLWKQSATYRDLPQFRELKELAEFVAKSFFKCLQREPKIAAEVFFWKSTTIAYEMEHGYGTYESEHQSKKKGKAQLSWEEEEEVDEELRTLFNQFNQMPYRSEALTMMDYLEINLTHKLGPKQIMSRVKNMGLDATQLKKHSHAQWTDAMDEELKSLVHKYRDMREGEGEGDVLDFIASQLHPTRTRIIIQKRLKNLGVPFKDLIMKKSPPWTDQLNTELMSFVEEFKMLEEGPKDMTRFIWSKLSEKRSLKDIRGKLVEIGVIQARQKRTNASHKIVGGDLDLHISNSSNQSANENSEKIDKQIEGRSDSEDSISAFTARFNKERVKRNILISSESEEGSIDAPANELDENVCENESANTTGADCSKRNRLMSSDSDGENIDSPSTIVGDSIAGDSPIKTTHQCKKRKIVFSDNED